MERNDMMHKGQSHEPYWCVLEGGEGEITEKKSRFLANVTAVRSEEEAAAYLEGLRKKYWDARHHCSAYILDQGRVKRCSDDGEPSGTAGRPMLEVLTQKGVSDCMVVVTRYFGGILLGTGGLARAYTAAAQAGLAASRLARMRYASRLALTVTYADIGRVQYLLEQNGIRQEEALYTDRVLLRVVVAAEEEEHLVRTLTDATGGRVQVTLVDRDYAVF